MGDGCTAAKADPCACLWDWDAVEVAEGWVRRGLREHQPLDTGPFGALGPFQQQLFAFPSAAPAAASLSPSSCCENLISTESSCSPVVHPMSLESDQMSSFHLFSCKAILWEGSSTQPSLGSGTPRSIPRRPGLSELQQGHSCVLSAWTRSHPQCWLLKRHNKITSHEQDVPANHGFAGLSAAT